MEFLEGPALDEVLAQRRLPWAEALDYTVAAARGLRAALAHGFIHRDVKPSNLVLDREAGIKILDFGLVKSLHGDAELTRNGAIIGSPLYMAPEQGRGEDVDHRADIYSLGCALYHMLTGRPPFSGPSPVGVIAMHMTERAAADPQPGARGARAPAAGGRAHDGQDAGRPARHLRRAHRRARGRRARRSASCPGSRPARWPWPSIWRRCWCWPTCFGPWVAPGWSPAYFIVCHRLTGQTLGKRLLRLAVTDRAGRRLSWKTAILRFVAFAWGPHRLDPAGRHGVPSSTGAIGSRSSWAASPASSWSSRCSTWRLAAVIFVGLPGGFLLAAFHPKKLALHDLLCRTEVRYRYKAGEAAGRVARFLKATTRFRPVSAKSDRRDAAQHHEAPGGQLHVQGAALGVQRCPGWSRRRRRSGGCRC